MCHAIVMSTAESLDPGLFSRLVDNLYVEAMVMADEARSYFDRQGLQDKEELDVIGRLSFTCESLKVTTRLMHVIAWLLTQKAWRRGEIPDEALNETRYRLGQATSTDADVLAVMPPPSRDLVTGSEALYERVRRLQESMVRARTHVLQDGAEAALPTAGPGPARDLLARLERAF